MTIQKVRPQDQPFRVSHENGDVIAGFTDQSSADADARERNDQAVELGISARYSATAKPAFNSLGP